MALLVASGLPASAVAQDQALPDASKSGRLLVSEKDRLGVISRAGLFDARDTGQVNTRTGRQFEEQHRNVPNDVTIECYYQQDSFQGKTEKFTCGGPEGPEGSKHRLPVIVTDAAGQPVDVRLDKIKVRYGSVKVYSSVITTRLEWALGFGSDVETPVAKVICHGCSRDPFHQHGAVSETTEFPRPGDQPQVAMEQKFDGVRVYVAGMRFAKDGGEDSPSWRWNELDVITDPTRRAESDALKLFAAFIQHVDSKALQNEILCRAAVDSTGACPESFLYVHDFGNSLGTTGGLFHTVGGIIGLISDIFGVRTIHPLDLRQWKHARVWKDEKRCVASLRMISDNGPGLTDPQISEPGRRLLAERLTDLIRAENSDGTSKLRDIFAAAHIDKYDDHGRYFTADDWVAVFEMRARQITEKKDPCP